MRRMTILMEKAEGTTPTATTGTGTGTTATEAPKTETPPAATGAQTATPDEGGILDGTTATETTEKPKEAKPTEAKPTEGSIEVKFPEGVEVDKGLMDEFLPIATDLGLKSEGAQKLVDLFVKTQAKSSEAIETAWSQTKQGWLDAVKKDTEFGGAKYDETVGYARKAIEAFGGAPLKQVFRDLGIGNHPEIVKFAARAGKAISEDSIGSTGSGSAPKPNDEEAKLREAFPSMYQS